MPAIRVLTWNILPLTRPRVEALFDMVTELQVDIAVVQEVSRTGRPELVAWLAEQFALSGYAQFRIAGETRARYGKSYLIILRRDTIRDLSNPVHYDCFPTDRSRVRNPLPAGDLRVPINMELEHRATRYRISLVTWHNETPPQAHACFNYYCGLAPVRGRFLECHEPGARSMYVMAGDLNVDHGVVTAPGAFAPALGFRTLSSGLDHISALMSVTHTVRSVPFARRRLITGPAAAGDHMPLVGDLSWEEEDDSDTEIYDSNSDTETYYSDMDVGPSGS